MVVLKTNHGDITLELDAENAPATVANFLQYVRDGHYDNTVFHRVIDGFMIQGGGMEPGMKQKPTRAPVANEATNGVKNKKYTVAMARTSEPHSATAQFFINVADNDFLDYKAPAANGWGYCVFGKVVGGQDVVDKITRGAHRQQRLPPERAEGRRRDPEGRGSRGLTSPAGPPRKAPSPRMARTRPLLPPYRRHRSTPAATHAVPLGPAPVAGPAGGAAAFHAFARRSGARGRRRLHPRRPLRLVDRRRPDARSVRRQQSSRRCAASRTPACRCSSARGNRDFMLGDAFARATGATLLPEFRRLDLHGVSTLVVPRRRAVHRRRRLPEVSRAHARSGHAGAAHAAALRRPPRDRVVAAAQEPQREGDEGRVDHGRQRRRGRGCIPRARRSAPDPRPHAPAGAPRAHVDGAPRERFVLADWHDRGHYLAVDATGVHVREVGDPGTGSAPPAAPHPA